MGPVDATMASEKEGIIQMTFADSLLFFYSTFATAAFTCQIMYFTVIGARQHLKERKLGADVMAKDESWMRHQN